MAIVNGAVPAGASEAVRGFLKYAIDAPDEAKAKSYFSAASMEGATFALPPDLAGAKYTVGEATMEGGQVWVPVEIDAHGQRMPVPFAPVEEGGEWKLDMVKTMQKMMGGIMGEAMGQMAASVGEVMKGIGEAVGSAFSGMTEMGAAAVQKVMGPGMAEEMDALDAKDAEAAARAAEMDVANVSVEPLAAFRTEVVLDAEMNMREKLELEIPIAVDYRGLLTGANTQENERLLDKLKRDVFSNWFYWVREVNEKVPLAGRVSGIRIEAAPTAAQRVVFAEGSRIVYRVNLAEPDGYYDASGLERIMLGVVAGMAERIDPRKPAPEGASYWPKDDSGAVVTEYEERIVPELSRRLNSIMQRDVKVQGNWKGFASTIENAAGLWCWGLQRVCGAAGVLMLKEENRGALATALQEVRIAPCDTAADRRVSAENGVLMLVIAPGAGEAGAFYEGEIADELSRGLGLATRPVIESLGTDAASWEERLAQMFKRGIAYDIDWRGFTSHPETQKNLFALQLLREHGIDHLYYGISGLAEKNPNFKQQFGQRVKGLRLEHVATPAEKGLESRTGTLVYKLALHDGYHGYLTIQELEKRLGVLVSEMPDAKLPLEFSDEGEPLPTPEEAENLERLEELQRAEDEIKEQDGDADEEDETEERIKAVELDDSVFARLQAEMQSMLPTYAQQLQGIIGKALPLEIAWESLEKRVEVVGELLNAALTPVLGGFAFLGQDPAMRQAVNSLVERVVVRKAAGPKEHGFSIKDRVMTFSAFLSTGMPVMEPQIAARAIKALLMLAKEEHPSTMDGTEETKPSPKKKSAAKKPAVKKPGKPATKKAAGKKAHPKKPNKKK